MRRILDGVKQWAGLPAAAAMKRFVALRIDGA